MRHERIELEIPVSDREGEFDDTKQERRNCEIADALLIISYELRRTGHYHGTAPTPFGLSKWEIR